MPRLLLFRLLSPSLSHLPKSHARFSFGVKLNLTIFLLEIEIQVSPSLLSGPGISRGPRDIYRGQLYWELYCTGHCSRVSYGQLWS